MIDGNVGPKKTVFKLVLLGDGGVGKTSIRRRYLGEGFSFEYMMTVGAEFAIKRFNNGIAVQIWDLAGQPRFDTVRKVYYQGTSAAVLVYDISREDTFYSIPNWITEVLNFRHSDKPLPLALVANKSDLQSDGTCPFVDLERGLEYAKDLSNWANMEVPFIETSAKTGFNVDLMFDTIMENINRAYNPIL